MVEKSTWLQFPSLLFNGRCNTIPSFLGLENTVHYALSIVPLRATTARLIKKKEKYKIKINKWGVVVDS